MTREINTVHDFFFSFVCTNLPPDTVDVELTIRMVKGIYTYHKDHTVESTIFTAWSKSVIYSPSLRKKLKAFKEDSRRQMTPTWNNNMMPQFSAPSKPSWSPRKHAPGKTRTWWSKHNHHFNPINTSRFDKLGTGLTDVNKINII